MTYIEWFELYCALTADYGHISQEQHACGAEEYGGQTQQRTAKKAWYSKVELHVSCKSQQQVELQIIDRRVIPPDLTLT